MEILFTKHAEEKFTILKARGWRLTKKQITQIISSPQWKGNTVYNQKTALGSVDEQHIIRIVFSQERDTIKIITFHITKK